MTFDFRNHLNLKQGKGIMKIQKIEHGLSFFETLPIELCWKILTYLPPLTLFNFSHLVSGNLAALLKEEAERIERKRFFYYWPHLHIQSDGSQEVLLYLEENNTKVWKHSKSRPLFKLFAPKSLKDFLEQKEKEKSTITYQNDKDAFDKILNTFKPFLLFNALSKKMSRIYFHHLTTQGISPTSLSILDQFKSVCAFRSNNYLDNGKIKTYDYQIFASVKKYLYMNITDWKQKIVDLLKKLQLHDVEIETIKKISTDEEAGKDTISKWVFLFMSFAHGNNVFSLIDKGLAKLQDFFEPNGIGEFSKAIEVITSKKILTVNYIDQKKLFEALLNWGRDQSYPNDSELKSLCLATAWLSDPSYEFIRPYLTEEQITLEAFFKTNHQILELKKLPFTDITLKAFETFLLNEEHRNIFNECSKIINPANIEYLFCQGPSFEKPSELLSLLSGSKNKKILLTLPSEVVQYLGDECINAIKTGRLLLNQNEQGKNIIQCSDQHGNILSIEDSSNSQDMIEEIQSHLKQKSPAFNYGSN